MSRPSEPSAPIGPSAPAAQDPSSTAPVVEHALWPPAEADVEEGAAGSPDPAADLVSEQSADASAIAEHAVPPAWASEGASESASEGADTAEALAPLTPERLRSVVESLLFASERPLTVQRIVELLEESAAAPREASGPPLYQAAQIKDVLTELSRELLANGRGIELHEVAGGWQLRTAAQNAPWVQRLLQAKPVRLSRAQLETMAIVAYRQPVTRPEIDDIRGVDSGGALKTLLDRQMVRVLGKKEEPGRPLLYGTTREFLEFFNLRDLKDLPTLREYHDLTDENREKMRALGHEPPLPGAAAEAVQIFDASPAAEGASPGAAPATAAGEPALDTADHSAAPRQPAADVAAGEPMSDAAAPGATFATPRELIDKQLADDAEQLAKIDEMIRAVNTAFPLLDPTLLGMVADGTLPPPAAASNSSPATDPLAGLSALADLDDEAAAGEESAAAESSSSGDEDDREPEEL